MAENDIYNSKGKYEQYKTHLSEIVIPPGERGSTVRYYCRNPANLKYFERIMTHLEAGDRSFIRRLRVLQILMFHADATTKDLAVLTREDINAIMAKMHQCYVAPRSKETFIRITKWLWRVLFPEADSQGRPDETILPYPVRHLSAKMDRSRDKTRKDRFTMDEFDRIIAYFGRDPRIQAFLTLSLESLARPQELLYLRMRDLELFDTYAKVHVNEHGKTGTGLLQCIDSYPYLLKWLNCHPFKNDQNAFLFINTGDSNRGHQLTPYTVNKHIKKALRDLEIDKPITCYSLKRNGVTIRRLRGESDMEIQHAARWTSTKQLKVYDQSNQNEAFQRELEKRGLIPNTSIPPPATKKCAFCNTINGSTELMCQLCRRPLDRSLIIKEQRDKDQQIKDLQAQLDSFTKELAVVKGMLLPELAMEIMQRQQERRRTATHAGR